MSTVIDFSADFGGPDAARAVLHHFRALKLASKGRFISGFPFPKLAFILRVDGSVSTFGQSGPGNIDVDKRHEYVSVDVVITRDDLSRARIAGLPVLIEQAILASIDLLRGLGDARLAGADWVELEAALRGLCSSYVAEMSGAGGE